MTDFEIRYRALESRDARFDGRFFTGVTTTGIYCRPICPARTPARRNVRFFTHAAAAESEGFRPCRRCRPEVSPDSPEWDVRADIVGRALRLIADGVADEEGIAGVARRVSVGERHLHRLFLAEVGASPVAVARSRRARLARQLLTETTLPVSAVAFAAGFRSIRTCNETVREIYRQTPTEIRERATPSATDGLVVRLRYRAPFDPQAALDFLAARAIPGVEEVAGGSYRRSVQAPGGAAVLTLTPHEGVVELRVEGADIPPLAALVQGARRLLDLDADPAVVGDALRADPMLRGLVRRRPGLRLPGAYDGFETAVRGVLGQQVTVAAATTLAGRVARRAGEPLRAPSGGVTHRFPSPAELAGARLDGLGLTQARIDALRALAGAVDAGAVRLDGSADPAETRTALLALPGIGPWTASYVSMRALRDPDAFPESDLGVRRALERLGAPGDPRSARATSERWRPWRAYGAMHLWASLADRKGASP